MLEIWLNESLTEGSGPVAVRLAEDICDQMNPSNLSGDTQRRLSYLMLRRWLRCNSTPNISGAVRNEFCQWLVRCGLRWKHYSAPGKPMMRLMDVNSKWYGSVVLYE